MADATHLSVMSKQIEDNKQATDDLKTQIADLVKSQAALFKSQSHMEAMLSQFISQNGAQTNRAPILNSPPSGCLTASTTPPQPPDPPDFNQFGQRLSKLEFPVFDGTLLDCWIAKVDSFFELEQYGNEEKLDLISLSVEGAALKWFRRHRREFTDWTDIKRKLMARFGLVKGCSPPEVLPKEKLITKAEIPVFENLHEPSRLFDDESHGTLGDLSLAPMKPYQSYSQSWYELDTIQSDINFKVFVAHECDMVGAVVIYEVATTFEKLAKTWKFKFKSNPERSKLLDDMFSFVEKSSEKYVMVWESHLRLLGSQQGNGLSLLNCLIAHDVLRLSSSKYTKNTLILVYHLCTLSSSRLFVKTYAGCIVALLMVYDAERLIQTDAPPIFSDLLCVKNRIRGRLKMVLLLEFLGLILFTSKMFKSSNVPQKKSQTDQKLSSYWKLLLSWKISQNIHVSSRCVLRQEESYVMVLELIKDRDSRKRKLCKNWWFKFKLNTLPSETLHLWRKRKSEKLQRASKHMICELVQNSWDMSIFGKSRTWLMCKMRILHDLKDLGQFTRAGIKFHLKHKWRSKFGSSKLTRTWTRQKAWPRVLPRLHVRAFNLSFLRTRMFSTGEYCDRISPKPYLNSIFIYVSYLNRHMCV